MYRLFIRSLSYHNKPTADEFFRCEEVDTSLGRSSQVPREFLNMYATKMTLVSPPDASSSIFASYETMSNVSRMADVVGSFAVEDTAGHERAFADSPSRNNRVASAAMACIDNHSSAVPSLMTTCKRFIDNNMFGPHLLFVEYVKTCWAFGMPLNMALAFLNSPEIIWRFQYLPRFVSPRTLGGIKYIYAECAENENRTELLQRTIWANPDLAHCTRTCAAYYGPCLLLSPRW